ncbi:MAG: paraquat-inducible protein A [Verrucomicrobiota bacterium]
MNFRNQNSPRTTEETISCPTCGKVHRLDHLESGERAVCQRCSNPLIEHSPAIVQKALAYATASLILFVPAQFLNLLNFNFSGQWTENIVLTGAFVLWQQGDPIVGFAVAFIGFLVPLGFNLLVIGACVGITTRKFNRLARRCWTFILELGEWSMLDVYLIGLGVSAIKLLGMGEVATRPGLWFVFGFILTTTLTTSVIRPAAIRHLLRQKASDPESVHAGTPCHHCGTLVGSQHHECPVCCSPKHHIDIPAMKSKILCLLIASIAFWIPANFLPVMTITMIGEKDVLTVMGGVEYLWYHGDIIPAVIIFGFSMVIPIAKILILFFILKNMERPKSPAQQTKLYQIVQSLGRWSMVDICVVSILAALGQLGVAATVTVGPAALPFCIVVVLTIFAANSFDTRVFWKDPDITNREQMV